MPGELFDEVILSVLKELPPDLKGALESVQILVREKPSPDQLKRSGLEPGSDLFGLFEGLSLKDWPLGSERYYPDRITLFEEPLRRYFPEDEDLRREVRRTLLHELGHFFGFNEEELRQRGMA